MKPRRKHRVVVEVTMTEPCSEKHAVHRLHELLWADVYNPEAGLTKITCKEFRRVQRAEEHHAMRTVREAAAIMTAIMNRKDAPMGLPGQNTGLKDRNGRIIRIGDRMRFDAGEWGSPHEFTVEWSNGALQHSGAISDLTEWCEVITESPTK